MKLLKKPLLLPALLFTAAAWYTGISGGNWGRLGVDYWFSEMLQSIPRGPFLILLLVTLSLASCFQFLAEVAPLFDRPSGDAVDDVQLKPDVVRQNAMMTSPAPERQFERPGRQRRAAEHAVGAPRQLARKPAERLVVQRAHGGFRKNLELGGSYAR